VSPVPRSPGALRRRLFWWPLILLVAVWSVLYLPHLRTSPHWYGDETLTLMVGRSLLAGEPADRAIRTTFWHPGYPYQPGYVWLAGVLARAFGGDILGPRLLSTLIALAVSVVIYLRGRAILGCLPALFGALVFLCYDQSIIHFRWAYPHDAVALGFTIAVLALLRPSRPRSDWTAGCGLAIAALSHLLFAHGALAAWLCRLGHPRAWLRLAAPPALVLAGATGAMILHYRPHPWVFDDMRTLMEFYRSGESGGIAQTAGNILQFYSHDAFHAVSALAVALCCRGRLYPVAVFATTVSFLLLQNRQNLPLFYYQAIVFLPLLALAWAGGLRTLSTWTRRRSRGRLVVRAAFLAPLGLFVHNLPACVRGELVSRNHAWVTQDPGEVEAAAAWINAHTTTGDLVICNQNIGWLLNCQTADLLQAAAWEKRPTFGFPQPLPEARFRYSADLSRARYVVLGDIEMRWMIHQRNVAPLTERLQRERWPVVWSGDYYAIAENPLRAGSRGPAS
jgi:hypothetical protein